MGFSFFFLSGMADLIAMMNTLVDKDGKILVEGISDSVAPVTKEELDSYKDIEWDVEDFRKDVGASKLIHGTDKVKTLMARWRFPSLSLHGIEGAFAEPGGKTVIPRKVIGEDTQFMLVTHFSPMFSYYYIGKFSIRIVPNMTPAEVEKKVVAYVKKKWAERGSTNTMKVSMTHGGRPWVSDVNHPNYQAGKVATKLVYGVDPDLTREGEHCYCHYLAATYLPLLKTVLKASSLLPP